MKSNTTTKTDNNHTISNQHNSIKDIFTISNLDSYLTRDLKITLGFTIIFVSLSLIIQNINQISLSNPNINVIYSISGFVLLFVGRKIIKSCYNIN